MLEIKQTETFQKWEHSYRVYFQRHKKEIILLLCGGDKSSQNKDIERAKKLAKEWEG